MSIENKKARNMRKKPDILLLLSILVVSGVIISNIVVIGHPDKIITSLAAFNAQYSPFQTATSNPEKKPVLKGATLSNLSSQDLVHIDSSKQQTRQ